MNQEKLVKDVRFLKIYASVLTILCGIFLFTAFATDKKANFDELDVKRINVKDDDGKLRMVIANKDRQHFGVQEGKPIERKDGRPTPGMIFFNDLGDEMGGLIIGNNGGKGQFLSLTYDKVHHSETLRLQHLENDKGLYSAGLEIWERANLPLSESFKNWERIQKMPEGAEKQAAFNQFLDNSEDGAQRIAVKKLHDKTALISLGDLRGRPRIIMSVAPNGNPKLNFLDENGKVIYSLPEDAKVNK